MLLPFTIQLSAAGVEHVDVGGQDVTNAVAGVSVVSEPGEVTQVYLRAQGGAEIKGDGIVTQLLDAKPGQLIAQWLRQLNPDEIEQHVMRESDMTESFTVALLNYLAALADHA